MDDGTCFCDKGRDPTCPRHGDERMKRIQDRIGPAPKGGFGPVTVTPPAEGLSCSVCWSPVRECDAKGECLAATFRAREKARAER